MLISNNQKIPIYPSDTPRSIIERLSVSFKTLPEYLYISNLPPVDEMLSRDVRITVVDLVSLAGKDKKNRSYKKWAGEISKYNFPTNLETLKVWISQNENVDDDIFKLLLQNEVDTLGIKLDVSYFIERGDLKLFKSGLQKKIRELSDKISGAEEIKFEISDIKSDIRTTKLEITQLDYVLTTNLTLSPVEFFDRFNVSSSIPFVTTTNFFKVVENFIPPSIWGYEIEEFLLAKIVTKRQIGVRERPTLSDMYSDVLVYKGEDDFTTIKLKLNNKNTAEERKEFIDQIIKSIDVDGVEVTTSRQSGLAGKYFIRDMVIENAAVFADLALNDKLWSYYININETLKATKKKTSIFFKFTDPDKPQYESVTVSVLNRVAERKDIEIRNISRLDIPYGGNYLRVKIRSAPSRESIDNFISIFNKLLTYYKTKLDSIVKYYKTYIPEFKLLAKTYRPPSSKKLKDIAPDVFIPGFSRKVCPHKPAILEEDDDEKDFITFPKTPEEGIQHRYWCPPENKEYIHIGAKLNKMENKDKYPVIPCCFQENQKNKKTSWYNKYMSGQLNIEKKEKKIPKTGLSVLNLKEYGGIPVDLAGLFYQIDPDVKYQRSGMTRTRSSFLECVLQALDIDNFNLLKVEEREVELDRTRRSTNFLKNVYLCKQQLYDREINDIQNILKSQEYLDPKVFIDMISYIYKTNIYVFSRKYRERTCNIMVPRNIYGVYRIYRSDWPTILILENFGNEADNLQYPQCELIVRWEKNKTTPDGVHTDQNLTKNIEIIWRELYRSLTIYKSPKFTNIILPKFWYQNFQTQYIDTFGKVRFLKTLQGLNIMTSPLPVFGDLTPNFDIPDKTNWDWQNAYKLIVSLNLSVVAIHIDNSQKLTEVKTILNMGNVELYIPIKSILPPPELKGLDQYIQPKFLDKGKQVLDRVRYNKKMSRCILSNFYHLYSKFLEKESLIPSVTNIERFIDKHVILDTSAQYPEEPPLYINSQNGIIFGNRIIINGEELLKRLLYQLRLNIIKDTDFLTNYRFVNKVTDFYQQVDDFQRRPNQIIVKGGDVIKNWHIVNTANFTIYNNIQPTLFTYFLENKKIMGEDGIFVANTRSTLEQGFLDLYNLTEIPNFILITKKDSGKWEKYKVVNGGGGETNLKITVIGYKYQGDTKYVFVRPY